MFWPMCLSLTRYIHCFALFRCSPWLSSPSYSLSNQAVLSFANCLSIHRVGIFCILVILSCHHPPADLQSFECSVLLFAEGGDLSRDEFVGALRSYAVFLRAAVGILYD